MFDVPSLSGVAQCVIDAQTIREKQDPTLISRAQLLAEAREANTRGAEESALDETGAFDDNEPAEAA
jgi:hypothetical protein